MKSILRKASILTGLFILSTTLYAKDAGLYIPYGITQLSDGTVYMADTYSNRVLKLQGDKIDVTAGTNSANGGYKDAAASDSIFNQPLDVAANSKGELFVADSENNSIRKIANGKVTTLSGTGTAGYSDGDRTKGQFNLPSGLAVDAQDNLYIADTLNHVIRKITPDGKVSTVAGIGTSAGYVDGSAGSARFNEPTDVAVAKDGSLYVADSGNHCIRKITEGKVTTVAGLPKENPEDNTYKLGGYLDGKSAQFNFPKSLIVLNTGEILVADMMNNAVRKIKTSGEVVTILNSDNDLEAPVGLMYKNDKIYVSQKWKAGLKEFTLGAEKVVSSSISHIKWLVTTPFSPASDKIQVWCEGTQVANQIVSPEMTGKDVYLPIRTLAQALGGEVNWDAKLKAASLTLNGKTLTLSSNNTALKMIKNNYAGEIKYLENTFGIKIDWVEQYRAIVISRQ